MYIFGNFLRFLDIRFLSRQQPALLRDGTIPLFITPRSIALVMEVDFIYFYDLRAPHLFY